jgi:hypothetical protein
MHGKFAGAATDANMVDGSLTVAPLRWQAYNRIIAWRGVP